VTEYRLVAEPRVDLDVAATYQCHENEQPGRGLEFLDQLRATYGRIAAGPFQYQDLRSAIRRALLRRFPTPCTSRWKAISSSYSQSSTRVGIRQSGNGDVATVWQAHRAGSYPTLRVSVRAETQPFSSRERLKG